MIRGLLAAVVCLAALAGCERITGMFAEDDAGVRQAYDRYLQALAAADVAAFKATVVDARRAELDAPDAKEKLALAAGLRPTHTTVTGIAMRGGKATMNLTATAEGGTATGTVEFVKEGGAWKVAGESWNIRIGMTGAPAAPAVAEDVARPTTYPTIRGQWRGSEKDGLTQWTFSFGDQYEVIVRGEGGFYKGRALIRWDLGQESNGSMRVPPGSEPMDVTITESSTPEHVGKLSLGAFMRSGDELKLCAGAPGSLVRAKRFNERSDTMRCFVLTQSSPDPEGATAAAPQPPPAPVAAMAPSAPAPQATPGPSASDGDATGELTIVKDGVTLRYPLKTGFRSETRMEKPGRATVHFGPPVSANSYHGIVLTLDPTVKGKHYVDGDELRSMSFADDKVAVGTTTPHGRKAVLTYYAEAGQMFPPKTSCTVEITSPYTGAATGVFEGRMSECLVHSAGIDYTLASMRFVVRGVSKR